MESGCDKRLYIHLVQFSSFLVPCGVFGSVVWFFTRFSKEEREWELGRREAWLFYFLKYTFFIFTYTSLEREPICTYTTTTTTNILISLVYMSSIHFSLLRITIL